MIRRTPAVADDVHRRATDWIKRFGATEPPRDVAVHARYCDECRRAIRAVDLLLKIDVGRAALPAVEPIPIPDRPLAPRLVVGGASLFVLVMAGLTVMNGMQTIAIIPSASPVQDVLGGAGSPLPSPLPEDDETAGATRSPGDRTPPPRPELVTPGPSLPFVASLLPGSTLPGQPTQSEGLPSASAEATRAPVSPRPTSTATSTPPTPRPTPSPPPSDTPSPATASPSPSESVEAS